MHFNTLHHHSAEVENKDTGFQPALEWQDLRYFQAATSASENTVWFISPATAPMAPRSLQSSGHAPDGYKEAKKVTRQPDEAGQINC